MDTSMIFIQSLFAFFSTLGFGILFNIKNNRKISYADRLKTLKKSYKAKG